jgi:hypothetical protein
MEATPFAIGHRGAALGIHHQIVVSEYQIAPDARSDGRRSRPPRRGTRYTTPIGIEYRGTHSVYNTDRYRAPRREALGIRGIEYQIVVRE